MSNRQKYIPPEPFRHDIDPSKEADCNALDSTISACINIACASIEKGLKDGFPLGTDIRFIGLLRKSLETHQVIRDIYRNYGKDFKPHQLCAFPLARQQIELVFNLALLVRYPDKWIAIYERNSLVNIYQRYLYEAQETRNLPRFSEGTTKRGALINSWMRGKAPVPIHHPFSEDELREIEKSVETGGKPKGLEDFPMPKRIIDEMAGGDHDSITRVLFRLYVEYRWLSAYVHLSDWALMTRSVIDAKHPKIDLADFHEKEVQTPVVSRSYLGMLIAVTDVSSCLKDPVGLRARLAQAWQLFEPIDFLFGFVWQKWAKGTLGLIG